MPESNRRLQIDEVGMLPLHQCGTVEDVYEMEVEKGNGRHICAAHFVMAKLTQSCLANLVSYEVYGY